MDQIVLPTTETPVIRLTSIGGDLRLSGWDQHQLFAETDAPSSVRAEPDAEGGITLQADGDCTVRVPRRAQVHLQHVGGDARAKALEGPLDIQYVGGDLTLRQTLGVGIGQVGGDLSAKGIGGSLRLQRAGGDVSVRSVADEVSVGNAGGDVYLRDVNGPARAHAGGDITLTLQFAGGREYDFQASGEIVCQLAAGVSARFDIQAGGATDVDVPEARIEKGNGHKVVTLGDGAARVALRAGGDVSLTGLAAIGDFGARFGEDFGVMAEEFAAQIESQIESQMAGIESQMAGFEKQLSERFGGLDAEIGGRKAEEIAARARQATERAQERVRRRAERHAEHARREVERAQGLAEAAQRRAASRQERTKKAAWSSWKFEAPRPPTPPAPPVEPVSDEERMAILRMVEQGKISVADAEKLLAALEK